MVPYHVGLYNQRQFLFLQKSGSSTFEWWEVDPSFQQRKQTQCRASSPAKAIYAALKQWSDFRPLNCGFCYTLPERDEVGCNAFFWQMAASYASNNGHYFDEELGHLCYVDFASQQALDIWRKIR